MHSSTARSRADSARVHGIHEVSVRIGLDHRMGWKTYDVTIREADPYAGAEPEAGRRPVKAEMDLECAARAAALGIAAKRLRDETWYTRGIVEFHRSAERETRRAPRADVHLQVAGPVV